MSGPTQSESTADREVVDLCRDLLRIDTSNYGDASGPGEREAAEYVAAKLSDAGLDPSVFESEPGRTSVVARISGADSTKPALMLHTHLDVVPAQASDWTFPPFAGEEHDGMLWGRGAVDMKDMCAMTLAAARDYAQGDTKPPRDLVVAFMADEEAGGRKGAGFLVDNHPELFEGVTEAVGEVGGFSYTVSEDHRLYFIETAEKGIHWMKLTAKGTAGHGSMTNPDNAVTAIAEAIARVGRAKLPTHMTKTVKAFLDQMSTTLGIEFDENDLEGAIAQIGPIARIVAATVRNTATPTMLDAGYKVNVIPGTASAFIDGRFLPGFEDDFNRELDGLLGEGISRETVHRDIAVETTFDGALVDAMREALRAEDPGAETIPYCLSGGTDAKHFDRLGIRCFGFAPLQLPADLDFSGLFHGVDERVPTEALKFGSRVLRHFIDHS